MKNYGAVKATEFTKKQISVLYYKAKNGEIKVEKWVINKLYDLANYYNYDYNGSVEKTERKVLIILDAMFNHDNNLQNLIDNFTETEFNHYTEKVQKAFNRNYV